MPLPKSSIPLITTALLLGSCDNGKSPGGSKNSPPVFSAIPNQSVQEGGTLSFGLTPYVSDPEGNPITLEISKGPGEVTRHWFSKSHITFDYDYTNPIDPDLTNNRYIVELAANDGYAGKLNGGSSTTTFTIVQQDNNPTQLTTRKEPLTSGLEALVLDRCIPRAYEYQREQTAIAVNQQGKPHILYKTAGWTPVGAYKYQGVWIRRPFGSFEGSYLSFHFDKNNVGHLSYDLGGGGEDLAYIQLSNHVWTGREIIDKGASVGLENDMVRDNNGKLHISHFAWSEDTVSYATNVNGSWENTTDIVPAAWDQTSITTDANTIPHIVYVTPGGKVAHLTPFTGKWQTTPLQRGSNPVIRTDGQNNLHLVFLDTTLHHGVSQPGSNWTITPLPNTSHLFTQQLAMQINQQDNSLHIVHTKSGLRYTTNQEGTWQTFPIDTWASYQNPDIALTPNGTVALSAMRNTSEVVYISFPPKFFTGQ